MPSVKIKYHHRWIYENDESFNIRLDTVQKYCDDNIEIHANLNNVPYDTTEVGTVTTEFENTIKIPTTRPNLFLYSNSDIPIIVKTTDTGLGTAEQKYYMNGHYWTSFNVEIVGTDTLITGLPVESGVEFRYVAMDDISNL